MLLTIAAFFFVISIVVFVHEIGHFVVAKLNRIFVITFSFGFGPKLLKKRYGETEYAISAFPLGGYVKFAGETGDEESEETEEDLLGIEVPPERLYRNKSPLQKMSVIIAGPLMNIILAILVYIFSLYINGIFILNPTTVIGETIENGPADRAGIESMDEIITINGEPIRYWEDIQQHATYDEGERSSFTVVRGADTLTFDFAPEFDKEVGRILFGFTQLRPARVGDVKKGSPADKAGIRSGSYIRAINDTTVTEFTDIQDMVQPRPGVPIEITWEYEGQFFTATVTPETTEAAVEGERIDVVEIGSIGVGEYYERVGISFTEAVRYAIRAFNELFTGIILFLGKLITGKATLRAIGGPLRVGMMAGEMVRWGFNYLISFLAFFSVNLAIFNFLPILPFDGGHFVIYLAEFISGRRMSYRVQQVLMRIGFLIFIALIVIILFIDVLNVFR
ncbi:MAG: RIP metalloprotease RseP [bacterium]|nr:MAG: RIP metalloprotease RseP [bacterium]